MPPQPEPSIKELLFKTKADAERLVKAQLALAQVELSASGAKAGAGGALGLATVIIALFAVLFLLLTLAFVLVALGLPIWAAMLIVTVLLLIIAGITGFLTKKNFDEAKPPTIAIAEFEKTKAALTGSPIAELPTTSAPSSTSAPAPVQPSSAAIQPPAVETPEPGA
jgi:uncharacterized membrane protein YqjE